MKREQIKSLPNMLKESLTDQATKIGFEKVKSTFGKDFTFHESNGDFKVIQEVTDRFIKKYDNKFKEHTTNGELQNVRYVFRIDDRTFCYVGTGIYTSMLEKNYMMGVNMSLHDMNIYIFGKKMRKYAAEVENIIHSIKNSDELGIFSVTANRVGYSRSGEEDTTKSINITYEPIKPRDIDTTIFFSHGEKEEIIDEIDKFISMEKFYEEKQVIYKIGFIFYGIPGTGKSSLVRALSTRYNRPIISIDTTNIAKIDLNQLSRAINLDEGKKYIVLLEDFDTIFIDRESLDKDPKLQEKQNAMIHDLQQFFDSNTSPNNVIFIATTNYFKKIDKSLIRGGRLDHQIEIKSLDRATAIKFCKSFKLSDENTKKVLENVEKTELYKETHLYNQSSLQTEILRHCDSGETISEDMFSDKEKIEALQLNTNTSDDEPETHEPEETQVPSFNLRVKVTLEESSMKCKRSDVVDTVKSSIENVTGCKVFDTMSRQNVVYLSIVRFKGLEKFNSLVPKICYEVTRLSIASDMPVTIDVKSIKIQETWRLTDDE